MEPILQVLIQNGGAVAVTSLFVWYMFKRDKNDEARERLFNDALKRFDKTVGDYLKESIRVKKELAEKLQRLSDIIDQRMK